MLDEYEININTINSIFEKKFQDAYNNTKLRGKSIILKYISSVYKRWYYSSLIEDTMLSPANLFIKLNETYEKPSLVVPTLYLDKPNSPKTMSYKINTYTIDAHPIVEDLKIFVESCIPDIELDEEDFLTAEHQKKLNDKLSIYDPYYMEYLLLVAIHLNLIQKIPSLYTNRAQVTDEFEKLYQESSKEIFMKIVTAAVNIATFFINETVPMPKPLFDSQFIISILKEPVKLDDIFNKIFDPIGIDFDLIQEMDLGESNDELSSAILSSTFFLGMIMDKYLFTPFGHYLKIINPLYLIPFNFASELESFFDAYDMTDDISAALFSPCYFYYLTTLGLEYFELEETKENTMPFPQEVPFDIIMEMLSNRMDNTSTISTKIMEFYNEQQTNNRVIYEIKIMLKNNKIFWKNLEIPSKTTLHDLFVEICYEFDFDPSNDYSFYPDVTENRFEEYTSPKSKRRSKKTKEITLEELNFKEKHRFILDFCSLDEKLLSDIHNKTRNNSHFIEKLELEIVKIKDRNFDKFYPRVSKCSKAFKA